MVTKQLLDYIHQNLAAGLTRADIEKELLTAGWQAQDVSEGFTAIVVPPPVASAPIQQAQVSPTDDNAAEVARIQHELETETRQQKYRSLYHGATAKTPVVGGIIGWLVKKKIVEGESQANIALLGVAIIAVVLAVGIFIWGNSSGSSSTVLTPQQLQEMQHPPDLTTPSISNTAP